MIVNRIAEGSMILELYEDPGVRAAMGTLLGGGGLWMLYRILRHSPKAIAEFMAEVASIPDEFTRRRAELRAGAYELQRAEIEARMGLLSAQTREWYATEASEQIWTSYQRLIHSSNGELIARMLDESGEELEEPSALDDPRE